MIRLSSLLCFMLLLALAGVLFPQSFDNSYLDYPYKTDYSNNLHKPSYQLDDSVLTVLGRWAWGPCYAVDVKGSYAFIGNGPTFQVLDVSEPPHPVISGEYLTNSDIQNIRVKDSIAFVSTVGKLLLLDISDPVHPGKISEVSLSGAALNFVLENTFVYLTTLGGAMVIIDVSDIKNPYIRNSISAGGERANCIAAKDGYVYVGNPEYPPMLLINATNPDSLSYVEFEPGGWGYSAAQHDTLLFLGVHGYSGTNLFKIYNVANPSEPELVGQIGLTPEDITSICVYGSTAYLYTTYGEIYSVSIEDLTQPEILDIYQKQIYGLLGPEYTRMVANGSSLLISYDIGMLALDIADPDSLKLQSFSPTSWFSLGVETRDSLAFVASGWAGLWIVDVSNPAEPEAIVNINTNGYTSDMVVEDTMLYMVNYPRYSSDSLRGLWVVNISDQNNPVILSHYIGNINFSQTIAPNSISKSGNFVFITQANSTSSNVVLEIIDISNPWEPTGVGVFESSYDAHSSAVNDTILYLATFGGGVIIVDISDPHNPSEITNLLDVSTGVVFRDPFLFSASAYFTIINVTDPFNPYILSSIFTHGASGLVDLKVSGNYAYWAEGELGVIDISNSANPVQITLFNNLYRATGVSVSVERIYVTALLDGLWILRNDLLTDIKQSPEIDNKIGYNLYQNYPNPFNPTTMIEFDLPQKELTAIEIFNVLGQKVRTLLYAEMERGKHKITFNAIDFSSGIYYFRLKTTSCSITKKMVIIK